VSRPDANAYAAELDTRSPLNFADAQLRVRCASCRTRLGGVFETEHGQLWIGMLGSQRDGRAVRRHVFDRAGRDDSAGRNVVAMWVEKWRTYYICDCKCRRNSAQAEPLHSALLARRASVDIGPQP
jgi:hypothetical protein